MEFDVFLCCSADDHLEHGMKVLDLLEANSYRVYYHLRDFLPGELIEDNIMRGVEHSKRTVCLVSTHFLTR